MTSKWIVLMLADVAAAGCRAPSEPQPLEPTKLTATDEAQKRQCIQNLYQLRGAIQQWALENSKNINARVTMADLEWYFRTYDTFPSCPAGGTYSVDTVWNPPTCGVVAHRLMPSYEEWKAEQK